MARISFSNMGNTPFQHLLGHNPCVLEHWNELENIFASSDTFSQELKEIRNMLGFSAIMFSLNDLFITGAEGDSKDAPLLSS